MKTKLQRRSVQASAVLLTIAVAAGVSGCQDSRAASVDSAAAPEVNIIVGGLEKVIYMPAKLAEGLNLFEKEGVKVNLLGEQSGATAENSLLTGNAQGVEGFYDHTIDLQAKGQCITGDPQDGDSASPRLSNWRTSPARPRWSPPAKPMQSRDRPTLKAGISASPRWALRRTS
jgi:hypothetical protein